MVSADKILSKTQSTKLFKKLLIEKDRSIALLRNMERPRATDVRTVIDFYIFSTIAHTGLRISEATQLLKTDIYDDFLIIRAEISKNKKKGTVYYGPRTKKLIEEFLGIKNNLLKKDQWDLVFSTNGKVPSRPYLHTRFKFWLKQAKLPPHFSIHSLRHTYATTCLDNGLSLTFVRDNLRHSNLSITSQYLHLTKENREKVKELF